MSSHSRSECSEDGPPASKDEPASACDQPQQAFVPLYDSPQDNDGILTLRAIAVGVLCGAVVNASNIYLGLRSGWGLSANLFAVSQNDHSHRKCHDLT